MYYPARGGIERVIQDISEGLREFTNIEVLTCQVKGSEVKETIHGPASVLDTAQWKCCTVQ